MKQSLRQQAGSMVPIILTMAALSAVVVVGLRLMSIRANAHNAAPVAAALPFKQAPDKCAANSSGKLVLVSVTEQHIWACQGKALVRQSAVTTGASQAPNGVNDATPLGTWRIYEKFRNLDLKGSDANGPWDDYVQYWMPFDTAVGFHDASWQTFPFGSGQYKTAGSHGCVQLPTAVAAWLYGWAPVGTTVTVEA